MTRNYLRNACIALVAFGACVGMDLIGFALDIQRGGSWWWNALGAVVWGWIAWMRARDVLRRFTSTLMAERLAGIAEAAIAAGVTAPSDQTCHSAPVSTEEP